jgi:rubrerythrin
VETSSRDPRSPTPEPGDRGAPGRSSRRRFLVRAGTGGALLTAAAAATPASWLPAAGAQTNSGTSDNSASGDASSAAPATTTTTIPVAAGDDAFVVFACSLELAFNGAYEAIAAKIVDPDNKALAVLLGRHHLDHAEGFRALATADTVKSPNPADLAANTTVLADLTGKVNGATGDDAVLRVAFDLENQAVSTYAFAMTELTNDNPVSLVTTVLPVDAEHAEVLGMTLGLGNDELFPGAFESGTVGDGNDVRSGFDPKTFPPSVKAAAPTASSSSQ